MKPFLLAFLSGALAACSSRGPIAPAPELSAGPGRSSRDDAIVAIFNGQPVTWRAVAEKVLELEPKAAIDQYLRWRLIEDRRLSLGITHTPEELRRRAEVYLRQSRQALGEEAFRAKLERERTTEEAYRAKLETSRVLSEMLTLDKIVRYQAVLEDSLSIERVVFAEEADARKFWEACREKGFDRASLDLAAAGRTRKIGRLPREIFPRTLPPAEPPLDSGILEELLSMRPGEYTKVETSRSNLYYVVKLEALRKGRNVPYAEARGEVLESLLQDPPRPEDYSAWVLRELARSRVEYAEETPRKEKGP
jgi:hypothetical protein